MSRTKESFIRTTDDSKTRIRERVSFSRNHCRALEGELFQKEVLVLTRQTSKSVAKERLY